MRPVRSAIASLLLLVASAAAPFAATAQIGETTDILTGLVIDERGNPVAGVNIEALSLETQITRTARTNQQGRFTILFPDGGGQYRMTAKQIGWAPIQASLIRYADEDRLVWNIQLSSQPFLLDPIEVQARLTPVTVPDPRTPGSVEQNLNPNQIANLPIDPEDLNVLATLVPGVVGVDETDSTGAGFSVAGQRPDANAITLDGMTFGSGNVPQEGLRQTRIVTSTYDVARGRFSGGLIASTSRSGSNRVQGSANYSLRDDDLAIDAAEESPLATGFTQHRISGGFGGPLISNRLFFNVSAQGRLRRDPLLTLTSVDDSDLELQGVAPDSVERLLAIADQIGAAGFAPVGDNRANDNISALLRMDYLLSNSNTLTLRGDIRGNNQDPTRVSRFGLPETGGVSETSGSGLMLRLASRIGLSVINEARAYLSYSRQNGDPFLYTPQGRVQVASDLSDGSVGIRTLTLGGNTGLPTQSRATTFEIANELSWLPGSGRHRIRLGGLLTSQSTTDLRAPNQFGTFNYNSLGDLEIGTPASYRRVLAPDERTAHSLEYAVYAGDVWRASSRFQLTYGLRLEGSVLRNPPDYNPELEAQFGVRTDRLPSEIFLSPRAGFTWTLGGARLGGRPDWIVRGGAGAFRSTIPVRLVSSTHASTGLSTSEREIACIGGSVPSPDWPSYSLDQDMIPTTCSGAAQLIDRPPNATVFSESFGAPKTWRTSLGIQRSVTALFRMSVDAGYTRGISQYGFTDLNLDTDPRFVLAAEEGREVFVDPNRIVPATGAVRLTDSRIDPAFGQVLQVGSHLASETKQIAFSFGGFTRNGIRLQTSYTWSHVRDQSSASARQGSAGFGSGTTAGNPNLPEWSRGSYERRHSFLATVGYPFGTTLEITAIGRLTSGTPYTPMIAGDVNGDGSRNDRAFIFSPDGSTPAELASGMSQLLTTTSAGARSCLERQFGQVAERNSCLGPWQGSLELQLNYRPSFLGLSRRLSISIVTQNLLRGIDDLLHGDNPHGWGLRTRPDATLLFVTGFDPITQQYSYAVNERFGDTRTGATGTRSPFQIGIQARFSFGPDRGRDAIDRLRGAGRGGGLGGPGGGGPGARAGGFGGVGTPAEFLERFQTLFPNPAGLALELSDSLKLAQPQIDSMSAVRDSLTAAIDSLAADLQSQMDSLGTNDPRQLVALIQPTTQAARRRVLRAIEAVRRILTPEQWEMLPEGYRNFNRQGRQRRPGGGPD